MQFLAYVHSIAECNRRSDSYFSEGLAMQALPFMKCSYIEGLNQN